MAKASSGRSSDTGKTDGSSAAKASAPATGGRSTSEKAAPGSKSSRTRKPPPVVAAQPRPWGWIAIAVIVAVFAVGAIGYAVYQVNRQDELNSPDSIDGLVSKEFAVGQHVTTEVDYGEDSPPFGGEHDQYWADCNGDVYPIVIRNENAVHGLEHGAVWITYNPDDLDQGQIDQLAELVDGVGYTMMSPYPGLTSPISLQAWGQQVLVDSPDDPRIDQFIRVFRQSPTNTPEPNGSCDNPTFAANPIPEDGGTSADDNPGAPTDAASTAPTATSAP